MNCGSGTSSAKASAGHRSRLRRRFAAAGLKGLADHEALELLLAFAIPRIDTKPLARALLARFGGLAGVFGATEADLQRVRGVGPRAALLVSLVSEIAAACLRGNLARRSALSSPQAVADYARLALGARPTERCVALFLTSRNRVMGEEVVAEGSVDRADVLPRRVVQLALERKAAGLILVHNHPGGDPAPSPEDDLLTRRLLAAARTVELRFLDHLIVGRDGHYSYREAGVL
jgi:DNA repair protein RadC